VQLLTDRSEAIREIRQLLEEKPGGRRRDLGAVRRLSNRLTEEDKLLLYETYSRSDQMGGVLGNVVPLLNLGSLFQGDFLGFLLNATAFTVSLVLVHPDAGFADYGHSADPAVPPAGYTIDMSGKYLTAIPNYSGAQKVFVGITIASYVTSLIEPFWFVHRKNSALADALGITVQGLQIPFR
jgi:hypothetical protein